MVFTPQSSNFSNVGVGALGVSMNSNSLSEPLTLWGLEDMFAVFSSELRRVNLYNSELWCGEREGATYPFLELIIIDRSFPGGWSCSVAVLLAVPSNLQST